MKLKFTFLITALLLIGNIAAWGQTLTEIALADLTSTDVFIIVDVEDGSTTHPGPFALVHSKGTSSAPTAASVTVTDATTVTDAMKWNISGNATDGYVFYPNGTTASWLYCTATNNGVRVGTNDNKTFTPSLDANNKSYLKNTATSRYIGVYLTSPDWRCYTVMTGNIATTNIKYYKYSAGTTTYNITFSTLTNGDVTADPNPAEADEVVTLTAEPNTGYELTAIAATYGEPSTPLTITGTGNTRTFTMPAAAVNVTATFSPIVYNITAATVTNGTIAVDNTATYNSTVELLAQADDNYNFGEWSVYKTGDATTIVPVTNSTDPETASFTMPAYDVTVSATFVSASAPIITPSTTSITNLNYNLGSGHSTAQSFTFQGANLTSAITVALPVASNFEVCSTIDGTYASSYTISDDLNVEKTVYVRLKSGLSATTYSDNITISSTGASNATVAVSGEVIPTYTVTFNPGTGSATYNSNNYTVPFDITVPENTPIDLSTITITPPTGWTFYGWAASAVEATQTTPTIISGTYTPTENVTLYAVYYQINMEEIVKSQTLQYDTWTYSGSTTDKSTYRLFHTDSYVESATFDLSILNKVIVYGGTFGGSSNNSLSIKDENGNLWKDVTVSGSSATGSNEYTDGTALSGNGKLRVISNSGTASGTGIRISKVEIYTYASTYNSNPALNGPCADPTFNLAEGWYYGTQNVELACATEGATIYYTTNGDEPTTASTLYEGAIPVSTNTTIKAKAYCTNYDPSATASATYSFMPDVAGTYVIAYKDGDNYYAMSQTANGSKLEPETVILNADNKVVTSAAGGLLWTIANTTDGVTLQPYGQNTNYLNIASGSLTITETADYFKTISSTTTTGTYNFKDLSSNYAVEYFNNLFTGYGYTEGTGGTAFNLYLLPYEEPTTYTITTLTGLTGGSISANHPTAAEGDEITVTVTPATDYHLSNLYYYTDDPSTTTAIDQTTLKFNMPAANVTIGATFAEIQYWDVTLSENVTTSTTIRVQQGTTTTLPSATTVPDGFTFMGWSTSTVAVTNTAPVMVPTEYTPSAGITLYAVYAIDGKWTLVSDASTLAAGDVVVIASNSKGKCAGDINSSNIMDVVDCTFSDDKNTITTLGEGVVELTLGGTSDAWTLANNSGELLGATLKGKLAWDNGTTTWSISIADNNATIQNGTSTYGKFLYNVTSPRFTTYTSDPQANMLLPQLYKKSNATNYTTTVTIIGENTTISGNQTWSNPTSLEGQVTISNGAVLTAINGLTNTNAANLIIEDGGQLIINNTGVMATVQKNIVAWTNDDPNTPENETSGWYSISSPVKDQNIVTMFGEQQTGTTTIDLYSYNEANYTWFNYHNGSISETTLTPGKGYLTAKEAAEPFNFVGELNNGSIPVALSFASDHAPIKGFNFVGNPYSQTITLGNQAIVSEYVATGYYKLVGGSYVASDNFIAIAPKEGFFVRATAADQTITFNNAPSGSKDRGTSKDQYISIEINNGTNMDRAYAMFKDVIGLTKVSHMDEDAPMLYIPQNGTNYAIASYAEDVTEIPVCFKTQSLGYYTISVKPQGEFNYIRLFDKVENIEIDMLNQGSYEFIGSPKDIENRFTITLDRVSTPENSNIENFAFISNNELVISNVEGEGTIQVIDIVGRVAAQYTVSGSTRIAMSEFSQGVYVVRLIDNTGSKTQKVVVK